MIAAVLLLLLGSSVPCLAEEESFIDYAKKYGIPAAGAVGGLIIIGILICCVCKNKSKNKKSREIREQQMRVDEAHRQKQMEAEDARNQQLAAEEAHRREILSEAQRRQVAAAEEANRRAMEEPIIPITPIIRPASPLQSPQLQHQPPWHPTESAVFQLPVPTHSHDHDHDPQAPPPHQYQYQFQDHRPRSIGDPSQQQQQRKKAFIGKNPFGFEEREENRRPYSMQGDSGNLNSPEPDPDRQFNPKDLLRPVPPPKPIHYIGQTNPTPDYDDY